MNKVGHVHIVLARAEDKGIGVCPAGKAVIAGTGDEPVVAIAAVEGVGAFAAQKDIIAVAAADRIRPLLTLEHVAAFGPKNGVGEIAADDVLNVDQLVAAHVELRAGQGEIDRHAERCEPKAHRVDAVAAVEGVIAPVVQEQIPARAALGDVTAITEHEGIVARPAQCRVVEIAAKDLVVPAASVDQGVVVGADQLVGFG